MFLLLHGAPRQYISVLVGLLVFLTFASTPAWADDGLAIGAAATVPTGESLRSGPGYDAAVITDVPAGTSAIIADALITASDGSLWYQVDVGGQLGYLPTYAMSAADVVDPAVVDPAMTDPAVVESTQTEPVASPVAEVLGEEAVEPVATGIGYIAGTNGDGAACRAEASYEATSLATLSEGSTVETAGVAVGEWQPVLCGGTVGYVNLAYVSWEPVTAEPVVEATAEPLVETEAEPVVESEAEPVVEPEASELTTEVAPAADESRERRGGSAGGGSGQAIADFAMQFEGYPYVYAGAGPDVFDCSGFTMYVIQQTLGIDITHDMFIQYDMGRPVDRADLQPGDLVFFQNTFRPGMSHNGIYIGNNQMIHAENENTGVKISDITSDYYASRWYGAVRFS